MDPITLALLASTGVSAVSGIAQFLNSKSAQNLNQSELNSLKQLAGNLQQPNFDVKAIPPAQLKVLQQYSPSIAQFVPEKSPQLVSALTKDAQAGRGAQLNALDQLQSKSDPLLDLQNAQAARQAEAASGSAIATANQRLQQQGMGAGSGLGYAGALSQAAASQDALGQMGLQNNANAYQRRIGNATQAAQIGSQIRAEDVGLNQSNANILNDYNRSIANMGNQYNQYAANQQNMGQQFNINQNQNTANNNEMNRYSAAEANQNRYNTQQQNQYSNSLNKLNTQFGLGNSQSNLNNNNAKTNNQGIQALGDTANTGLEAYKTYNRKQKPSAQSEGY